MRFSFCGKKQVAEMICDWQYIKCFLVESLHYTSENNLYPKRENLAGPSVALLYFSYNFHQLAPHTSIMVSSAQHSLQYKKVGDLFYCSSVKPDKGSSFWYETWIKDITFNKPLRKLSRFFFLLSQQIASIPIFSVYRDKGL